jgi:spore germination protein GerM
LRKKAFPPIVLALLLIVVGVAAWLIWRSNNPGSDATVEVTLYFANDRYVQFGDANEPQVLPEKRTVRPGVRNLPETVMDELIAGPDTAGLSTVLSNLKVHSVSVREGIAHVDFSKDNMNGGSLSETLLIDQTVRSLTALDEIEAVQFLIDGEKTESLMGHILVIDPVRP